METLEEIKAILTSVETDFKKFYGEGNKSAGVRVRNAMMKIKLLAQKVRLEVQQSRKTENKKIKGVLDLVETEFSFIDSYL